MKNDIKKCKDCRWYKMDRAFSQSRSGSCLNDNNSYMVGERKTFATTGNGTHACKYFELKK